MKEHRLRRVRWVIALVSTALVAPTTLPASAVDVPDQVLAWNRHAYNELIVTAAQPPPVAALHMAMVHGAVYDAVNAIDGGYQPYLGAPASAEASDSKDAAAAAAAYRVLLSLLPGRAAELTGYYEDSLLAIPDGPAETGGIQVGEAAAAAMIAARTGDGRFGDPSFTVGTATGEWRPIVAGLAGNNFKWVGEVKPFIIPSAAMFATPGPLSVTSEAYAKEFDEVKALGSSTSTTRTADQTAAARFWNENAIAMWTRIARDISTDESLTDVDNARLFAMLYLTGSDAVIACFQDKERWHFWRPQTAIREAADDGNPKTQPDTTWTSLLPNPPYPDQPSGHNCFSSSIVETFRDFFGTNRMAFSATNVAAGITRGFTHFSQAIGEIRLARVWGGLHFMTADAHGVRLGRQVADWRNDHAFQPVT